MAWVSIVVLGFLLGMRHATDPDHVIAVTTIVSRERSIGAAVLIGIIWGIGHTLTIALVGGAMIAFGVVIPPRVGLSMELAVAVMLMLLGVLNLTGILGWISAAFSGKSGSTELVHSHPHSHGFHVHTHPHVHAPGVPDHGADAVPPGRLDLMLGRLGLIPVLRPLIVGIVHGLAGSAAVALLVLTTIRDPVWAVGYLLVFGVGTIAGMMLITAVNALPFAYTARRFAPANRYLRLASGLLSLSFGVFLVYQIGFVDGLFTSHPQ